MHKENANVALHSAKVKCASNVKQIGHVYNTELEYNMQSVFKRNHISILKGVYHDSERYCKIHNYYYYYYYYYYYINLFLP